jgi:hypothetical protein
MKIPRQEGNPIRESENGLPAEKRVHHRGTEGTEKDRGKQYFFSLFFLSLPLRVSARNVFFPLRQKGRDRYGK